MFKIASCILVAACIGFQQQDVVAASLLNPLRSFGSLGSLGGFTERSQGGFLGSLLDNAQDKVSDVRNKISDTRDNVLDKISDARDNARDKISDARDNAQDKLSDIQNKFSDIQDKLSGIREKFPDILKNIIERGDETLRNLGDSVTDISEKFDERLANEVQRLKEKSEQFLKDAQDVSISSCAKLCKKGRAALAELVSMFDSCILNETRQAGKQIQDLVEVISDLQKNLSNELQDVMQCFKSTSDLKTCLSKGLEGFYKLGLTVEKGIRVGLQLYSFYPSLKFCCQTSAFNFARNNVFGLLEDVGTCVQSTFRNIQ